MLTLRRLRSVLHYSPDKGTFTWRVVAGRGSSNRFTVGSIAGYVRSDGRRTIQIDKKSYLSSRLAWFYMKGTWPSKGVDHKDGNCRNDKWDNLRLANQVQNGRNRGKNKNNTTGYKGVHYHKKSGRFTAKIKGDHAYIHLGYFATASEAATAYRNKAKVLHKEFVRT